MGRCLQSVLAGNVEKSGVQRLSWPRQTLGEVFFFECSGSNDKRSSDTGDQDGRHNGLVCRRVNASLHLVHALLILAELHSANSKSTIHRSRYETTLFPGLHQQTLLVPRLLALDPHV